MNTYREILRKEFVLRVTKNPRFSLRAYSKALGISPTSLSLILSGKQGLGLSKAQELALRLGLMGDERESFLNSVGHSSTTGIKHREESKKKTFDLSTLLPHNSDQDIIKDWYHLAILELTELEDIDLSPKTASSTISKMLSINELAIKISLQKLQHLGLLTIVNGRYQQTKKEAAIQSSTPSESIRSFHEQILSKAKRSIYEQSVEERDLGALIVPMGKDDYLWAQKEIKKLRRKIMSRTNKSLPKNQLICFSTQLFSLLN